MMPSPITCIHGAFVVMDGIHHPLADRVEALARFLGIAVGEQLHGALEVGEEHRDLLALAFERALGDENLLNEVLGRVRLRSRRPNWSGGTSGDRLAALEAEAGVPG